MSTLLAVTDTHALIWAATGTTRKLGRRARALFERADAGEAVIYVPTLSFVEVGEAVRAGRVRLGLPAAEWIQALLATRNYVAADLTVDVVSRAEALYGIPERSDRLIAATALVLDCPLITRDPDVTGAAEVEVLW